MTDYYADKLSGERLKQCYAVAPPRVRQYLEAEIAHVLEQVSPRSVVLELGCGYGRALARLAPVVETLVGIDNAHAGLQLARDELRPFRNYHLAAMDAMALGFKDATFDVVVCIQNGISAFRVDKLTLLRESLRVTKPGGLVLFFTYAENFWEPRLAWFEIQAEAGLLGKIDQAATGDGVIVCADGFRTGLVRAVEFEALAAELGVPCALQEVDGSSLFCTLRAP